MTFLGRVIIAKADGDSAPKVTRLEGMDTEFVSLVPKGANRQTKMLVVKAAVCPGCGATVKPNEDGTCPECGAAIDGVAKAVPAPAATPDEKRTAQEARAKKYGIGALASGANLSYPSGDPTSEALYGDPVNLKYPIAYDDNKPDPARIRNGLARFAQNASAYPEADRGKVWERLVRAALAAGITHGYDPKNPLDASLPADLKDKLSKDETSKASPAAPPGAQSEGEAPAAAGDFLAALESALQQIDSDLMVLELNRELTLPPPVAAPAAPPPVAKCAAEVQPSPAPTPEPSEVALRKALEDKDTELAQLRDELRKAQAAEQKAAARARTLSAPVDAASALRGADAMQKTAATARPIWRQDLAAVAAEAGKTGR